MYLLTKPNELSNFFLGFGRKQRKDKGVKRLPYNKLSKKTRTYNTKVLYKEMFGGEEAVNAMSKTGIPKKIAKQYHMDIAKQYDQDLYEGKDPNVGLNKVNKKYSKYFKR